VSGDAHSGVYRVFLQPYALSGYNENPTDGDYTITGADLWSVVNKDSSTADTT
jgi:hypothetical protein